MASPKSKNGSSGGIMDFLKKPFKSKETQKQPETGNKEKGRRTKRGKRGSPPEPSYEYMKRKPKSKQSKQSLKSQSKRSKRSPKSQSKPFYDDLKREIVVEVKPGLPTRRGIAMVDMQCPDDMISRRFAEEHLGFEIKPHRGTRISTTIMGEHILLYAKIPLRWYLDEKDISTGDRLCIDPTFQNGTFLVTNAKNRFDIIIGSRTIEKLRLLDRRRRFIAPFFRAIQPKVDDKTVKLEQAKADDRRKKEQEEMEREQERIVRAKLQYLSWKVLTIRGPGKSKSQGSWIVLLDSRG